MTAAHQATPADHLALSGLLNSYFRGFDQRRTDDAFFAGHFTADARLEFPAGRHTGLAGMGATHRRILALWGATLHAVTNHVCTVDGAGAELYAVLNATHVHRDDDPGEPLFIGAHVTGAATRTADGWRLHRLALELVWHSGDGPGTPSTSEDQAAPV